MQGQQDARVCRVTAVCQGCMGHRASQGSQDRKGREDHQARLGTGAQMAGRDRGGETDPKDRKDDLGYRGCKD